MTAYENVMVILGVIGSLIAFGMSFITLLEFLDKRNNHR